MGCRAVPCATSIYHSINTIQYKILPRSLSSDATRFDDSQLKCNLRRCANCTRHRLFTVIAPLQALAAARQSLASLAIQITDLTPVKRSSKKKRSTSGRQNSPTTRYAFSKPAPEGKERPSYRRLGVSDSRASLPFETWRAHTRNMPHACRQQRAPRLDWTLPSGPDFCCCC